MKIAFFILFLLVGLVLLLGAALNGIGCSKVEKHGLWSKGPTSNRVRSCMA